MTIRDNGDAPPIPPPGRNRAPASTGAGSNTSGAKISIKDIESSVLGGDSSIEGLGLDLKEWYAVIHRVNQQNTMIRAMIRIFGWLNGAVIGFILCAWLGGLIIDRAQIITEHVVMSLIGATIIQAGLAFITITRFLFPTAAGTDAEQASATSRRQRKTRAGARVTGISSKRKS